MASILLFFKYNEIGFMAEGCYTSLSGMEIVSSLKIEQMKKMIFTLVAGFALQAAGAQARLATADFNKTLQPAVEIEIPFPEKTVLKSMVEKIERKGYRAKEIKGYMVFKGVIMEELGTGNYDLYFKADRKSRKEKDASILTLMVASGGDRFIGDSTDARVIAGAKELLNRHVADAEAYDLELQITAQEEMAVKADKKYNNLVEDHQDLLKKKERLEKDIAENIQKQAEQKAAAEKERQILTNLKAKRKQ